MNLIGLLEPQVLQSFSMPEKGARCRFSVFIINSEHISHIALVFPLLALKK